MKRSSSQPPPIIMGQATLDRLRAAESDSVAALSPQKPRRVPKFSWTRFFVWGPIIKLGGIILIFVIIGVISKLT